MNLDQILSILRVVLSVGGPVGALLVARGMSADQVTALSTSIITICGALPPIIAAVWGAFAHTDEAKVAAAAALPGVAAVVVKVSASDGVAAAAADPTQPKVVSSVNVTLPQGVTK
jgi:hypothetical protein